MLFALRVPQRVEHATVSSKCTPPALTLGKSFIRRRLARHVASKQLASSSRDRRRPHILARAAQVPRIRDDVVWISGRSRV